MNRLGLLCLILSLLCFLVTLGFKLALSGWMPFLSFGLGFGIFFFTFAFVLNFKYFKNLILAESTQFWGKSLTLLALSLILVAIVNFIFIKKNWRVDLTQDKIHSLSDFSENLLKSLSKDLRFIYFHADNARVKGFEKIISAEVERYHNISDHVSFASYSIFQRPDLVQKYKIGNEESALYLEYKGRIERISDLSERVIANSILKLIKKPKKLYFLQGHGERKIDDPSTFGLKGLREQLERLHYSLAALEAGESIPNDAALLAIVGPKKELPEQQIDKIQTYLKNGGAVFVAIDPEQKNLWSYFLKDYGFKIKKGFVFSNSKKAGQSSLLVPTHKGTAEHEVAQNIQEGQNPYLFISSSLELVQPSSDAIQVHPLLEHLPDSVLRADVTIESSLLEQGSQIAGAISEGVKENFFRLAVMADSDFMSNQFYSRPANFDFTLGLLSYLSKDEEIMKMQPRVAKSTFLLLSQTQLNLYFLFFIVPFALVFFILAAFLKLRSFF